MRFFGVFLLLSLFLTADVGWSQEFKTFQLKKAVRGSKELKGKIFKASGSGILFRLESGGLSSRIGYNNFSEESLKQLIDMDPNVKRFAGPLLGAPNSGGGGSALPIMPPPARTKLDPPAVSEVEARPELPEPRGVLGALFGTGPGLILLLLVWGANIWAGYAIGIYRRWPKWMVPTISAVGPIVAPIVFMSMKPKKGSKKDGKAVEDDTEAKPAKKKGAAVAKPVAKAKVVTARPGAAGAAAGAARPAAGAAAAAPAQAAAPIAAPAQPGAPAAAPGLEAAAYVKGEVNINKRFIETKFAPFFKLVPDEPYRSAWLCFITTRGEFWAKRIPKITQTDVTVQCPQEGGGQTDQVCQIADIKEIHLRPPE
ncbi:MAG: hypothetical protein ACPGVU_19200 [Limisphaerales bacterium]